MLERLAATLLERIAAANRADCQAHRLFEAAHYLPGSWDRPQRVIVKAERLPGDKPNPRFVFTNLAGDPRTVYEDVYCRRGDMKNRIEEQQRHLFADRNSCHRFLASQFRGLLAAAYGLVDYVRRTALADRELARAEVGTLQLRLLRVGALVVTSVRWSVVRLSSAYPWPELFLRVAQRLEPPRPAVAVP